MYERQNGNDMEVGSYAHRPILMDPDDIPSIEQARLSPTELPFTEDDFEPQVEQALELMPDLLGDERAGVRHAINGLLSLTPDGMPCIGETEVKGLWSCAAIWIKEAHPRTEVVGVDGDSTVLSLATRKAEQAAVSVQFDEAVSWDLPYPDAHFDRVVSSLFFHHLSWEDKRRTVQEICRLLRPGGQLHVADWGKAGNVVMRGLFICVQLLDGFRNTQDNVAGRLVELFEHTGLVEVSQRQTFSTIFGTLALYSSVKPG
jgi:SAM-dependent methyltransferase